MIGEPLSTFTPANDFLDDPGRLESAFREDGYLFFREVLDPAKVLEVQRDFLRVLQDQGVVTPGASEPLWTGAGVAEINDDALYGLESYVELIESEAVRRLMERVFGGPVFLFKGTNIRYALPHDSAYLTPAHQDHFFIRGNCAFRTVWVPLMDIDRDVGGLAVAARSHQWGLREHREQKGVYSYQMKGRTQRGVGLESIGEPWLTADYRPGDVLVFHGLALHRALPNRSKLVRLSLDARCQPAAVPRMWQAEKTIPEQRRYRQEVQRLALADGASEEVFEAVIIEMMKRGAEADQKEVRAVLAELGRGLPAE